jgi:hypothetical protein
VREECERLNAQILMQQQVLMNTGEKDADIASLYKDEISELKESCERKEYLL